MSKSTAYWSECPMEDVLATLEQSGTNLQQGWSPQCEREPAKDDEWGVLKTTSVQDGLFLEAENKRLPDTFVPKANIEVRAGDLLMTCAGPRSRCGVVCLVKRARPKLMFSGKIYRFRPDSQVMDSSFLTYQLRAHTLQAQIEAAKTGISESGLNMTRERFLALRLTVPPIKEQKRIAQTLDALLAQVDTLKTRIDRITNLLKHFRQATIHDALAGKLTTSRKDTPDASTWSHVRAEDACDKVQSGGTPKEGFTESGIPFLKVYNIVNGAIDFEYRPQHIADDVHRGSCRKSITRPGDVLMNIVGPPLGKIAVVTSDYPEWNINQAITLFRPGRLITSGWIHLSLLEGTNIRNVLQQTKGSAGQVNISLSQCRDFVFSVPPVEIQNELVLRVEQFFTVADQLEAKVAMAKKRIDALTQSILAKAFRGELVPQDPNDEPASVVLERIRAQRAAAPKPKRGRKAASN